jgi:general secretion pathway protein G
MKTYRTLKRGFTLVEILIVVIILGILAAIVIPQFTNASQDARKNSLTSQLQTIRSQIELYKLQHRDTLPDLITSWDQLTMKTDEDGNTTNADATLLKFGPYLQANPVNPIFSNAAKSSAVIQGDGTGAPGTDAAWTYDYGSGSGTGKFWASSKNGGHVYDEGDPSNPDNDDVVSGG